MSENEACPPHLIHTTIEWAESFLQLYFQIDNQVKTKNADFIIGWGQCHAAEATNISLLQQPNLLLEDPWAPWKASSNWWLEVTSAGRKCGRMLLLNCSGSFRPSLAKSFLVCLRLIHVCTMWSTLCIYLFPVDLASVIISTVSLMDIFSLFSSNCTWVCTLIS